MEKKARGGRAQLLYTKCICSYCNSTLACRSSLNRHLVSCATLKHLLEHLPQSINESDVKIRNKQLELLQRIKDRKKKVFSTCSLCLDVINEKDMKIHLMKAHSK